ncbi:MAG: hypothetical protein ACOCWS_03955 [Alkalispirochaetaceae bacterium]
MSTTASTPEKPYTVVGGSAQGPGRGSITLVLLNRGGKYLREEFLARVEALGFGEIISVEGRERSYNVEALARSFPRTRFLLLESELSPGVQVNLAARECRTDHFYAAWHNMELQAVPPRLMARLEEEGELCVVPTLRSERGEVMPTLITPGFHRGGLRVLTLPPQRDGMRSLYPYDFVGVYNLRRFQSIGGFAEEIPGRFWQLMDFGFRAHMWSEVIRGSTMLRATYASRTEPEDQTADATSYPRFFLRNLLPRVEGSGARLPRRKFLSFLLRTGVSLSAARRLFKETDRWVDKNSERFGRDARSLVDQWNPEDESR